MEELLKELQDDIDDATILCSGMGVHDGDYKYWNGVRCQAEKIKKSIKLNNPC